MLDLPGLYSLRSISPDEAIACEALEGSLAGQRRPELILFVMDATCMRRNLYLFTQLSELGLPIVVVLTMVDLLKKSGKEVNIPLLKKKLGVPLVLTTGPRENWLRQLKTTICRALQQKKKASRIHHPQPSETEFHNPASEAVARYRWVEELLSKVENQAQSPLVRLIPRLDKLLTHRVIGLCCFTIIVFLVFQAIYLGAQPIMDLIETSFALLGTYTQSLLKPLPILSSLVSDGIINGVGSVIVFLPQIMILFLLIGIMEDSGYMARAAFLTDRLFSWSGLNGRAFIPLLSSFACAIPGIMATRTIPDTKARLTTIFVAPLMSCSARLPVYLLLIGAFIEPLYGALWAGLALFALHILGLAVALPTAFIFNRALLRGKSPPFLMELPPYHWPRPFNILHRSYEAGRKFVLQAGTIVFALSIVIWTLSYFPRLESRSMLEGHLSQGSAASEIAVDSDRESAASFDRETAASLTSGEKRAKGKGKEEKREISQLEYSYLGRLGRAIAPAFAPLGFDWKITVGILSAFPAREVIVSTLGIIYDSEEEGEVENYSGLRAKLATEKYPDGSAVFSLPTVISILVFFALCCQCMSTLAVIKRETGHWKWPLIVFAYMTALAYLASLLVYQGGRLLGLA